MPFIVIFLLMQSFYIFASDDDGPVESSKQCGKYEGQLVKTDSSFSMEELLDLGLQSPFVQQLQEKAAQIEWDKDQGPAKGYVHLEKILKDILIANNCTRLEDLGVDVDDGARAACAPAAISSDISEKRSDFKSAILVEENPKLAPFYDTRVATIQQKNSELLPYFDRDILSLLANPLDKILISVEEKDLYEVFLWKAFLDVCKETFKKFYVGLKLIIAKHRIDDKAPCEITLNENDVYKKFVKKALGECLSNNLLEYEKKTDFFVLTPQSKMHLIDKIGDYIDEYCYSKIEKYQTSYRLYASDKVPKWVPSYIERTRPTFYRNQKFLKGLYIPTILNRIAYDLSELQNMLKSKNSETSDSKADLPEVNDKIQVQLALSFFYQSFYTEIFEKIYKDINFFKTMHAIDLEDEKIFSFFSKAFETFEYNIFHKDFNGNLRPIKDFGLFLVSSITLDINRYIGELCNANSQKYAHVPVYIAGVVENDLQSFNFSEKSQRRLESIACAAEAYKQNLDFLSQKSQEYDQQQKDKKAKDEQAAANKAVRDTAERERRQKAEGEEAEQARIKLERNKRNAEAAQTLYKQRDIKLEDLRQILIILLDLEETFKLSKLSDEIKKRLIDLKSEIESQQRRFNSTKDVKKELQSFESNFKKIEEGVRVLRQDIEREKSLKSVEADLIEEKKSDVVDKQGESLENSVLKEAPKEVVASLVQSVCDAKERKKSVTWASDNSKRPTSKGGYRHEPFDTQDFVREQYIKQFGNNPSRWPIRESVRVFYPNLRQID